MQFKALTRITAALLGDVLCAASSVQFKALTRITVKPLVETLPCLGGVTVSLMEVRIVSSVTRIFSSWVLAFSSGTPFLFFWPGCG
jgi:hypothetical protein